MAARGEKVRLQQILRHPDTAFQWGEIIKMQIESVLQ